ncbi:hypothetical protein [Coxiella-like endosymbiont]|uniref:hypothetical protein n=1 Tax=Coxiella-like endosymbiont TaxID=1592897 RepID=UPI00272DBB41|nr:hypothetical protein [Coxiella-like endosymbiont]
MLKTSLIKRLDLLRTINDFTFNLFIENIKGDIYAAIGNNKPAAEKSYEVVQNEIKVIGIDDPYLKMKIFS